MTFINLVPPIYYNVKQYGAVGYGVTDDTTAIANARSAANAAGGGTVYYPTGIFISGNQTLYSFVTDLGAGIGATTIKLKNGANTDLFSAQTSLINLSAAFGSGIVGNLGMFSMRNLTLDGNKANQSSGPSYPLRFYGYTFVLRDLEIKNGYSGGVQIDWSGTTPLLGDSMEASIEDIKVHDSNGIGFQMGGPHDSFLANIMSFAHSSHGFHFAPNAAGALCMNIHPFFLAQSVSAVGILCEAQGC